MRIASTDGYFLWSSAFIELSSLQSIAEGQKACPYRVTDPKLLVSSKFLKELTMNLTTKGKVNLREIV
jgi:hypothetical protein